MSDIRYFGSQSDFTEILFITIYHLLLFLYYQAMLNTPFLFPSFLHSYPQFLIIPYQNNNIIYFTAQLVTSMYQQQQQISNGYEAPPTTKNGVKFQVYISDELKHFYDERTKVFKQQLMAQYIGYASVYEKQLDKPLQWYKKTFAFFARINPKHQFLVFQLQSKIYGSVDFYIDQRVVLRLGNKSTIVQSQDPQNKRRFSTIKQKNERPYTINMQSIDNSLTFGDFLKIIYEMVPETGYSQLKFNGSHYSEALMKEIRKQKKGKGSIIRSKIVQQPEIRFLLRKYQ